MRSTRPMGAASAGSARSRPFRDGGAGKKTRFGQKYEVRGILEGPSGRRAQVVTAWIVLNDEEVPRFLTALPGEA